MLLDAQLAPAVARLADQVTVTATDDGDVSALWQEEPLTGSSQKVASELAALLYKSAHARLDHGKELTPRTFSDPEFDRAFHETVGDRNSRREVSVAHEGDEHTIVVLDSIRVAVAPDSLSRDGEKTYLRLSWARPSLSPGFFFLTSCTTPMPTRTGGVLRLYAHLADPDHGPALLARAATYLEDRGLPWQAKASSSRDLYPRTDAVVVYLPRVSWSAARELAQLLESGGNLAEGTSAFTHALTASVGVAFEPADKRPGREGLSFGQHRCRVLAEALVTHATATDGQSRTGRIVAMFNDASIDPLNPARNLSSPVTSVIPAH
ncbi:T3SS effector HopA1 family protein [Streptomyces sp. NBC_00078]|uniref:T3SS effector HopA1 family protein n=1 Tax=unclassified Streptomyces TaxID=2593676 RepID=UPI0022572940|nr:T3SS effector HopA1 family protein [Streptomyces sp. NBC_00078]MCX5421891.1 T3SS effector HopA1 family protein [Streptomyces sp. NBC_00078]